MSKGNIKKGGCNSTKANNRHQSKRKVNQLSISQLVKWCKIMRFEDFLNIMHCDFFEIHKDGEIEKIECEDSGVMLAASKKYFDYIVKDFYIIRAKNSNELGLMIIL